MEKLHFFVYWWIQEEGMDNYYNNKLIITNYIRLY